MGLFCLHFWLYWLYHLCWVIEYFLKCWYKPYKSHEFFFSWNVLISPSVLKKSFFPDMLIWVESCLLFGLRILHSIFFWSNFLKNGRVVNSAKLSYLRFGNQILEKYLGYKRKKVGSLVLRKNLTGELKKTRKLKRQITIQKKEDVLFLFLWLLAHGLWERKI